MLARNTPVLSDPGAFRLRGKYECTKERNCNCKLPKASRSRLGVVLENWSRLIRRHGHTTGITLCSVDTISW